MKPYAVIFPLAFLVRCSVHAEDIFDEPVDVRATDPAILAYHTPDAEGILYRIVKGNPPTNADMLSHHETGRLPKANPCLRCGLSVFRIIDDALNQQKLHPKLGNRIAKGSISFADGKACQTQGQQSTHTTWWPYEGVDRAAIFVVVKEVA